MDECAENSTICENGKFCDNTPGSHVCRGKYLSLYIFCILSISIMTVGRGRGNRKSRGVRKSMGCGNREGGKWDTQGTGMD